MIIHVETMEHLMRDVLKYRSAESIRSFENFCSRHDPHHLVIVSFYILSAPQDMFAHNLIEVV